MNGFKARSEIFFGKLGVFFFENRFKTIFLFILLTIAGFSTLKNLMLDVRIEGFLKENDTTLMDYDKFREDFVNDELIVLGIKGDEIFSIDFLKKLKNLHDELESQIPYLDDITSLINVRNTRGEGDELVVEDLLENFPESMEELSVIKKRVGENVLYKNLVISEDFKNTSIVIQLLTNSPKETMDYMEEFGAEDLKQQEFKKLTMQQSGEAVEKVYEIIKKYKSDDFKITVSGTAAVNHFLVRLIPKDVQKFLLLVYLGVIVLLFLIFRRISGVLFPVIIVSLTLIFTLSLFSIFQVAIKLPTQTLPSFLLAVSVCYSVHILALFYYSMQNGESKKEAVENSMSHSGMAILLTGITTAAGLFSFSGSDNAPVGELGIFAGAGVFIAVFLTFILLPALLSFVPEGKKVKNLKKISFLDPWLKKCAEFSTRKSSLILVISLIIAVTSFFGFQYIEFSHNTLKWLPATSFIRQDTESIDESLRGSVSMEVIIDTKKENGLYEPSVLRAIEKASKRIENLSTDKVFTGKAWSLVEILKETNQALHGNDKSFYKIPETRDLCAQELFLFSNSGSDDLEDFTDSSFSKARLTVKLPFRDAVAYHEYIQKVDEVLKDELPGISVESTGIAMIYARVIATTIEGMKISYIIAISIVTILMIFLLGNIRVGLLSMVPNLFPIIVITGLAGYLRIPFSLFIMLIGNIVIGLAVDDTIHFMHNFKKYHDEGFSCRESVEKTLLTSGRAMLLTSMILSGGFFIYLFSALNNLKDFGIMAGVAVLLALGADFFITPALMAVFFKESEDENKEVVENGLNQAV